MECPLDHWWPEKDWYRVEDIWNRRGTVIGRSDPIKLTIPIRINNTNKYVCQVGGWLWVKLDTLGTVGVKKENLRRI